METTLVLSDVHTGISARDAEATIEPPVWIEVPVSHVWDVLETAAIATREDIHDDVKKDAWAAFTSTGCRMFPYESYENIAAKHAKQGIDPRESVLPSALVLPDHAYRKLEAFVKTLDVKHPTRRRRATA